jgi:hypothetical protein
MTASEHTCHIALTEGEPQPCLGPSCPFWEEHDVAAGCGLERLSLDLDDPELASYLLDLRRTLEETRNRREREAAREAFAQLAPPDLAGR